MGAHTSSLSDITIEQYMTVPGVGRGQSDYRGGTRRTVDATPTAKTLSAQGGCGTPTKGYARLRNVHPDGARTRREVSHMKFTGMVCEGLL